MRLVFYIIYMNDQNEGTIKKLMTKGFGFISVKDRKNDLFFHMSNVIDPKFSDLMEGDTVTFENIEDQGKGDAAVGIRLKR